MSKPIIIWSDPPKIKRAAGGRPLKYTKHLDALKERPGEWACLCRNEDRSRLTSMYRSLSKDAYLEAAAPYRLELTLRRTPSGDYGLWARLTEQEAP